MSSIKIKLIGDGFGWCGTCFSIIFYMAPAQPYSRLVKKEITINDIPFLLIIFSYLNNISWIAYGLRKDQYKPVVCNTVGAILSLVFIIVFCAYYNNLKVKKSLFHILIILNFSFEFFWLCYFIIKNVITLGYISMILNIFMYIGTLEKIDRVISSHNYHLIPILSATLMFINAVCWVVYGFAYKDINIIIANILGVIIEIIGIVMWCFLRNKYPCAGNLGQSVNDSSKTVENNININNNNSLFKDSFKNNKKGRNVVFKVQFENSIKENSKNVLFKDFENNKNENSSNQMIKKRLSIGSENQMIKKRLSIGSENQMIKKRLSIENSNKEEKKEEE
jgi:hypothetical protein